MAPHLGLIEVVPEMAVMQRVVIVREHVTVGVTEVKVIMARRFVFRFTQIGGTKHH